MSTICDDLRAAILQAAIQGKLTKQSEKEKVSELAEKVSCKELEEAPFIIPKNWRYIKLGDVATHQNGYAFKPSDWKLEGLPIIRIQDLTNKNNTSHYTDGKGIDDKYFINAGDVLVSWSCTIDSFLYDGEEAVLNQHIFKVIFDKIEIDKEYYILAIKALLKTIDSKRHGSTMTHITKKDYDSLLMPIPPVSEQKRIVEKVDKLMARVTDLEESADALASLKKAFPDDIKASLLQAAMQGKLTKQLPEDGDANELMKKIRMEKDNRIKAGELRRTKKLPDISEADHPCTIPDSWSFCYIDDIAFVTKLAGFEYTKDIAPNLAHDGIPLFKGKNVQNGKLILDFESYIPKSVSDMLPRSQIRKKCLLTPYVGTIGNIAIFDGDFQAHLGSNVGKIELLYNGDEQLISEEFLLYYLRSKVGYSELTKHKKATAQESISIDAIRNVIVPIPPLAEQKRIVERLDILMQNITVVRDLIASE